MAGRCRGTRQLYEAGLRASCCLRSWRMIQWRLKRPAYSSAVSIRDLTPLPVIIITELHIHREPGPESLLCGSGLDDVAL